MPLPDVTADWIADRATLQAWLDDVPADAVVGLDTEFMRRDTFHPQLALLQLGCEYGQGFLFARPAPAHVWIERLSTVAS